MGKDTVKCAHIPNSLKIRAHVWAVVTTDKPLDFITDIYTINFDFLSHQITSLYTTYI